MAISGGRVIRRETGVTLSGPAGRAGASPSGGGAPFSSRPSAPRRHQLAVRRNLGDPPRGSRNVPAGPRAAGTPTTAVPLDLKGSAKMKPFLIAILAAMGLTTCACSGSSPAAQPAHAAAATAHPSAHPPAGTCQAVHAIRAGGAPAEPEDAAEHLVRLARLQGESQAAVGDRCAAGQRWLINGLPVTR